MLKTEIVFFTLSVILTNRLKPSEDLSSRRPEMLWQKSLALVLDSTSNTWRGHRTETETGSCLKKVRNETIIYWKRILLNDFSSFVAPKNTIKLVSVPWVLVSLLINFLFSIVFVLCFILNMCNCWLLVSPQASFLSSGKTSIKSNAGREMSHYPNEKFTEMEPGCDVSHCWPHLSRLGSRPCGRSEWSCAGWPPPPPGEEDTSWNRFCHRERVTIGYTV